MFPECTRICSSLIVVCVVLGELYIQYLSEGIVVLDCMREDIRMYSVALVSLGTLRCSHWLYRYACVNSHVCYVAGQAQAFLVASP